MPRIKVLSFALVLLSLVLQSCGTNSDVVSNSPIQKRVYRKGLHISAKHWRHESRELAARDSIILKPDYREVSNGLREKTADTTRNEISKKSERRIQLTDSVKTILEKSNPKFLRVVSRISEYQETSKAAIQRQFGKSTFEEPEDLGKDYGIAALIVSILALLVFVQVPLLNIAFAIVAILLAKKAMINGGAGERLGRIAKILGQIALGLGIFFTIFIGIIVAFAIAGVI